MSDRVRWISRTGLGIALFVVFTLCLQVPVFENYYLCLGYVVMAVYCYSFGTAAGTVAGVLGVVLYCLLINGLRGMPGWALGNAVIGVILSLAFGATKKIRNPLVRTALNIAAIAAAVALGILIVKSLTESVLYGQIMGARIAKNMVAFIADLVMLIVSLPVCELLDKVVRKMCPRLVQ